MRRLRGSEGEREGWDMNRRGQWGQREGIATRGLGLVGVWNMLGDLFGGDLDLEGPGRAGVFLKC